MKIINGQVVFKDAIRAVDLYVEDGRIQFTGTDDEIIDAKGAWITPGFIDVHSDYIEHMSAPRPTSLMDLKISLAEAERELLVHGITTMYHSLSLYKDDVFAHKPIRTPEKVKKLMDFIYEEHSKKHLVRHRFHARFEIDNLEQIEPVKKAIEEGKIQLLSFMDHTPGQGQYRNIEVYCKTLRGYQDISTEFLEKHIKESQTKAKMTFSTMQEIAQVAKDHNIPIASHDDDSEEKVVLMKSLGTSISEFPISLDVAKKAIELGSVAVGAPNILLGGSHSGNLSAAEAILNGCADILCSDYYPASLLHSIFYMNEHHDIPIYEMVNMLTLNPATALGLDDFGSIEEGKVADLLFIRKIEDLARIEKVMVDGKVVLETRYRI
ncbi:phosphonate metabolism protein PhnM [Guggenheimella bovis]